MCKISARLGVVVLVLIGVYHYFLLVPRSVAPSMVNDAANDVLDSSSVILRKEVYYSNSTLLLRPLLIGDVDIDESAMD
jgi:hypothetical protein